MVMNKFVKSTLLIILLIFIDQSTKTFLIHYLKTQPGYYIELLPILDIVYSWNYGISFGLFRNYYQYSNYVFLLLNSIIILYLIYLLKFYQEIWKHTGLMMIIGGAFGNLIDRIFRGAVFDFIYFHYHNNGFPAFNFADSFITLGAMIFIYGYIFFTSHKRI